MSDKPLHLELSLAYSHGTGALTPYFDALVQGRALASRCGDCSKVWFAPHVHCPDDGGACDWIELDGGGEIVAATQTRSRLPLTDDDGDHVFVLVAMNGADNRVFGRLANDPGLDVVGCTVRLVAAPGAAPHPAQAALFELVEKG